MLPCPVIGLPDSVNEATISADPSSPADTIPEAFAGYIERVLLWPHQIAARVDELGQELSQDYAGRNPILLGILTGSFIFCADLCRAMRIPCEVKFVRASSYQGTQSSGHVTLTGIEKLDLNGRDVVIVEDIVDTGLTARCISDSLKDRGASSVEICSFLVKQIPRPDHVPAIRYVAFEVPDLFVVGYGLDWGQTLRQLPFLAVLKTS
mmetsp:Transcript_2560/g.4505  ORF Transcript_2560/g.4505 Transcript_2560/m.4505 type:complete len:208 (+) Transcript_2560:863-1486(+)